MRIPAVKFLIFIIYLLTAFIIYQPALKAPFYLDDFTKLKANEKIYAQGLLPTLKHNFTNRSQLADRPILIASTWINYKLFGMNPQGFKFFNILFHALTSFALFTLLHILLRRHRQTTSIAIPTLLGLFYLLHPVHSFAINFILQRGVILAGLFGLLGLTSFLRYQENKKNSDYLASILFILLSFFCKPTGIAFAFIIGLYLWLFSTDTKRQKLLTLIPFLLIALIPLYYKLILHLNSHENTLPWYEYFTIQLRNYFIYLKLFFIPLNLHFFYEVQNNPNPWHFFSWLAMGTHSVIIVIAIKCRKSIPIFTFCVLSVYLAFMPESSIFPIKHLFFEYRSYLPFIFITLAVAVFLTKYPSTRNQFALAFIITILGILCIIRNHELRNDTSWRLTEVYRNPANHDLNYPAISILINTRGILTALEFLDQLCQNFPGHGEYFILRDILNQQDLHPYLLNNKAFSSISKTQLTSYWYTLNTTLNRYNNKKLLLPIKYHYFYSRLNDLKRAKIINQYKNMLKIFRPENLRDLPPETQHKLLNEIKESKRILSITP